MIIIARCAESGGETVNLRHQGGREVGRGREERRGSRGIIIYHIIPYQTKTSPGKDR